MEMSHRNQCTAILNKQKCHVFTKMENRRAEQVLSGGVGWVPVGVRRIWEEGV
jgi:hypothetical protein